MRAVRSARSEASVPVWFRAAAASGAFSFSFSTTSEREAGFFEWRKPSILQVDENVVCIIVSPVTHYRQSMGFPISSGHELNSDRGNSVPKNVNGRLFRAESSKESFGSRL